MLPLALLLPLPTTTKKSLLDVDQLDVKDQRRPARDDPGGPAVPNAWSDGLLFDQILTRHGFAVLHADNRGIGARGRDFAQAACAPEAILITSARREGQPAVKSRWLWRLETLAKGAGLPMGFPLGAVIGVASLLMIISVASGLMAMVILKKSQPADLLR